MILKDVNKRVKNVPDNTNKELEPISNEYIVGLFSGIDGSPTNPIDYYTRGEVDKKIQDTRTELINENLTLKSDILALEREVELLKLINSITPKEINVVNGKLQLTQDKVQYCNNIGTTTQIALPINLSSQYLEIKLNFPVGTSIPTITFPSTIKWQAEIVFEANKIYELILTYTNSMWLGGFVSYNKGA